MIKQIYSQLIFFAQENYTKKLNEAISSLELNDGIGLIDIGAAGEIMPKWKRIESQINYHGFEPDKRSREKLLIKKNRCHSYQIYENIVTDQDGGKNLYLCETPTNSSTYPPNKCFNTLFPYKNRFEVVEILKLSSTTLDQLDIKNADFIKLDIQGGELNALRGAKNLLSNILGLEIEIEFQEIYKKQPLFNDINSFMKKHDFEFIDFPRLVRWDRNNIYSTVGQCVWGDALYMRTPEYLINEISNIDVIKRYLAICLIYHRYDYINILEKHYNGKINIEFFLISKKLRRGFLKNQLLKRRFNNLISLFNFYDEEAYSLH